MLTTQKINIKPFQNWMREKIEIEIKRMCMIFYKFKIKRDVWS